MDQADAAAAAAAAGSGGGGESKGGDDVATKRTVPRIPAHTLMHIAELDGSVQALVATAQCQKATHELMRGHHLNLSDMRTLTHQQIIACAQYWAVVGLHVNERAAAHMEDILQSCTQLNALNATQIEDRAGTSLFSLVPNLRELRVGTFRSSQEDMLAFLRHLPNIEHVSIEHANQRGDVQHFVHTPHVQHISIPNRNLRGNIAFVQHCPALRHINFREARHVVGDIVNLQHCPHLKCFAMLRTGVSGDTRVVRRHLRCLEKWDVQSTRLRGKTSDFRFCDDLAYLRYWGTGITGHSTTPRHDNGTQYTSQYKGLDVLRWLATWSKESEEVKRYERQDDENH